MDVGGRQPAAYATNEKPQKDLKPGSDMAI
jgi:hypothetical protein